MTPPVTNLLTARLAASLALENQMDSKPSDLRAAVTRVAELVWENERLREALQAMLVVMDSGPKPVKLDAALSWRECDEKARTMAIRALDSTPAPSSDYLAGWQAAIAAADQAVMQENPDGWGYQWPGRPELAAAIRRLVAEEGKGCP